MMQLTARRGSLRISKQHNTRRAVVDEFLESRLFPINGLNLAAKVVKIDHIARGDLTAAVRRSIGLG